MAYQFYDTIPLLEAKVKSLELQLKKEEELYSTAVANKASNYETDELQLEVQNLRRKVVYFTSALHKKQGK